MTETSQVTAEDSKSAPRLLALLPELTPKIFPGLWKEDGSGDPILPCVRCQRPMAWHVDERQPSACPTCGDTRNALSRLSFTLNQRRLDFREFRPIYLSVTATWFFLLSLAAPWFWPGVKDVLDPKVYQAAQSILAWATWPLGAFALGLLLRSLWIFRGVGLLWFFFKLMVISLVPVALMGLAYLAVTLWIYYTTEQLASWTRPALLLGGSLILMKLCSLIAERLHRGLYLRVFARRLQQHPFPQTSSAA